MSIPSFSVRNSVLVNMVMILIIAMGTYALITLPMELFPQVKLNRVIIRVAFPGASPEEVEKLVVRPIEDEIQTLDHLDFYLSTSVEGLTTINVVFESVTDDEFRSVYANLRREVDRVELPDEAKDPEYVSLESSTWMPTVTIAVSGDLPESRLKQITEQLEDEIESMSGVDAVSLAGVREREIWVEVDPQKLYRYGLSLEQVALKIRRQNIGLASGNIRIGTSEYLVRSMEEFETLDDIRDVVIQEDSVGNHVRLRDVAEVRDTFEEPVSISRFNGKPSLSLNVYKSRDGNTLDLIERLEKLAEEKERGLPANVDIALTADYSVRIINSIQRLVSSGLFGGVLVLILLLVFLGWRNALLVCWGIPITFLLTFTFLEYSDYSLNESSLFALVLVLGMIVDDAIVVVENIARYLNRGVAPREAAIRGTEEVMWPVFTSSLTTIAAFLPLMLLPGMMGEWLKIIPICVSMALAASLFESLIILPAHLAELGRADPRGLKKPVNRLIRKAGRHYRRMLGPILRWRWAFLGVVVVLVSSSFLVIPLVGVDLYEGDEYSILFVHVWMPEGSSIEATDSVVRQFEDVALSLPQNELRDVVVQIGQLDTDTERLLRKDVAQVIVSLNELGERQRSLDEIVAELEMGSAGITGFQRVQFRKIAMGPPVGNPIEVKIKGRDVEILEVISGELMAYLDSLPGVFSIEDDLREGKNEIRIEVDKNRAHLVGLDSSDIARQIKYAFEGVVATVIHDSTEETDLVVKYQEGARATLTDIYELRIPTATGDLVPFQSVAAFVVKRGWSDIRRFDGERAITVSADVDPDVMTAVAVTAAIQQEFRDISANYPGYRLDFRGEWKEFEEAFNNISRLFLVGIILIYLILGAQFRSYLQPALVLAAIPFAFAGAMLCLLVSDFKLSINIMYGLVALSGIAVNDSIVLINFINQSRQRGASLYRAVLCGAKRRLRPILLTTVTTMFGLLPLAMGVGGASVTWMPLASTIVWGLGVATFLILMVIPPLYVALEDVRGLFLRRNKPPRAGGCSTVHGPRSRLKTVERGT